VSGVDEVFPEVAAIIADALACDVGDVARDSLLVEDLGAESIDFLDIVFRLEQHYGIEIPRGRIVEEARGDLAEEEFARNGILSTAGVARLRVVLSESPADRFRPGLKLEEVPLLFTVETFCKLVNRARGA